MTLLRRHVTVSAGERVPFQLSWFPSHEAPPPAVDPVGMISSTEDWWAEWSGRCQYEGPFREEALRSLITLKALTYEPTGAIVAAPTTSLPEELGGERNWDYRFCWLRDGAFTLIPFVRTGYRDESVAWRNWLLRAVAGDPAPQLMYGIGRAPLTELELCLGFEGSRPVRMATRRATGPARRLRGGDGGSTTPGELANELYEAARPRSADWSRLTPRAPVAKPDEGIWEIRGSSISSTRRSPHGRGESRRRDSRASGADVPLIAGGVYVMDHADVLHGRQEKNSFVQY
jgi:GH15 family glucan-1,4-alpha-glucosidase